MRIDFEQLCRDQGIRYLTSGHKHSRPGWVQVQCPFCTGHEGWHLGWSTTRQGFHCWRCGAHRWYDTVAALCSCSIGQAKAILQKYRRAGVGTGQDLPVSVPETATVCNLPPGAVPMCPRHHKWLLSRGFNPAEVDAVWGLLGTGHLGLFKHRIVAPIKHRGQLLSFQCRDITGKARSPYMACPQAEEVVQHQRWLYGLGEAIAANLRRVLVVEGITDVWRMGVGAVATFGIDFTLAQVQRVARFPERVVLFDTEAQAQAKAQQLGAYLSAYPGHTEVATLDEGDPADLTPGQAVEVWHALGF